MRKLLTTCAIATALTTLCFAACVSPTAGVPIELTLAFEGLGPSSFVTASGWEVELTEARASIASIYAYAPAGETALLDVIGPARAYAHGGTDLLDGHLVRAELLDAQELDALAAPVDVATVDGLAGNLEALTIVLGDASGPSVWASGTARRDDDEITFELALDLGDERLRRIEGADVDPDAALDEGSRLVVGADASAWLAEADFTGLASGAIAEGTEPHRALYLGARSAASWGARVETQE